MITPAQMLPVGVAGTNAMAATIVLTAYDDTEGKSGGRIPVAIVMAVAAALMAKTAMAIVKMAIVMPVVTASFVVDIHQRGRL